MQLIVKIMTLTGMTLNCNRIYTNSFALRRTDFYLHVVLTNTVNISSTDGIFCPRDKNGRIFYSGVTLLPVGYFQDSSTICHIYRKYFPAAM